MASAQPFSLVKITLWDKGKEAAMTTDQGIGMTSGNSSATMGLKLSRTSVKAGEVVFRVKNGSQDIVHEMVVFPYKKGQDIPYSEKDSRIDEDAAGHLGEVSELDPGQKGELKISLKPGTYVLACNIAGHYMAGMWALLTVK